MLEWMVDGAGDAPKKMDPVAGVPNFFEKDKLFTYRRCPIFDNKAEDISGCSKAVSPSWTKPSTMVSPPFICLCLGGERWSC